MVDQSMDNLPGSITDLTPALKEFLNNTRNQLKGCERRQFMARVVSLMGPGGQIKAERELGWDRKTIIKGRREIESGFTCIDNFSGRGRKSSFEHFPNLKEDITTIVNPICQTDPTFRTQSLYSPISANEVRRRLIENMGYDPENIPIVRTISSIMNKLGFKLKKVAKAKVKKKIAETDMIFKYVHRTNRLADETDGVLRISIDCKATIKIGPYSRGGYSRCGTQAADHDFKPDCLLRLFGISIPALDENYMYFTESHTTPDFMIDALRSFWITLKSRFDPHTLVINLDNGPENSSRRSQFIKRLVEFSRAESVNISLVYYPPYHSKYNPIERVWGVLENHWKGELLDKVEKVLGLCRTMKWNGKNPVVQMVKGVYPTGVRLGKSAMDALENLIIRIPGIEKWAVDIPCYHE